MLVLRGVTLVLATLTVGIMAGVFQVYAYAFMPGLGRTDDRTFVGAFQEVDKSIVNPLFLLTFLGAFVFTAGALVLSFGPDGRSALPWLIAATLLYLLVLVVTFAVNVPLNDALKAAGAPDTISDLAAVRERFDEAKWVRWNVVRAIACTGAFGALIWSLVLHGRSTG
jgi:uncharacterized membrane protein